MSLALDLMELSNFVDASSIRWTRAFTQPAHKMISTRAIFLGILVLLSTTEMSGQSYSFFSTLRAGLPGGGDWEIGVGTTSSASKVTSDFGYETSGQQYWRDGGQPQNFRIGWNAAVNSAYVTVWNAVGVATTATMSNPGAQLSANALWTLPGGSMFTSATGLNQPSSILVSGLTLSPGVALLSGALPAGLGASQAGTSVFNAVSAPIVINPAANGGNWYLDGTVRFTGLTTQGGNASRSSLQFMMLATGSDVPEASSILLIGGGLITLAFLKSAKKAAQQQPSRSSTDLVGS